MGPTDQYRSDLAREKAAHRRTMDKLVALEERMEAAEAQILVEKAAFTKLIELLEETKKQRGLIVRCRVCAKVLTQPGVLLVRIGAPDENNKFEGVKEHLCNECDGGE